MTRGDWGDWVGKQEDGLAGGSLLVLEGLDGQWKNLEQETSLTLWADTW